MSAGKVSNVPPPAIALPMAATNESNAMVRRSITIRED
jgi:hypothetical protein